MTRDQIRDVVVRALREIAPEADASTLDDAAPLRDALDLDSMDFLNLVTALHTSLGVDVPEADYPKVRSLGALVGYLAAKLASRPA
jgi:acyl carrier protein